jgi:hypothetical protein
MPAQPNNALADGINKNLAAGNQEVAAVQNLQSVEQNHGSTAQVSAGIQGIQGAFSTAVGDRTRNQAINNKAGRSNAAVTADLNKVATAQGNAQANIDKLNGGAADAAILSSLKTTLEGGAATNANALSHVNLIIQNTESFGAKISEGYRWSLDQRLHRVGGRTMAGIGFRGFVLDGVI